jgi:hypothetical protein
MSEKHRDGCPALGAQFANGFSGLCVLERVVIH